MIWQKDLGAKGFGCKRIWVQITCHSFLSTCKLFSLASSDFTRINLNESIPAAASIVLVLAKMTANAEGKVSPEIPRNSEATPKTTAGCCSNQKPKVQPVRPQLVR